MEGFKLDSFDQRSALEEKARSESCESDWPEIHVGSEDMRLQSLHMTTGTWMQ
jgi:hypothetical protein